MVDEMTDLTISTIKKAPQAQRKLWQDDLPLDFWMLETLKLTYPCDKK
jgi:hypothetical protein